jgi:thiol-disulfide isomerase/thioredoxin
MVDWDRVQELRSKGWDWGDIAKDPKVDFHPDASAGNPGRALRALYHRTGRRAPVPEAQEASPKRAGKEQTGRKWTLTRFGWLFVPLLAVWFALAYAAPSPVGLVVPAIPYLALALAAVALVLIYALWRKTEGPRWSTVYRNTVVGGVVVGLVVAGGVGLVGVVVFGCPYLPPSSSLSSDSGPGWESVPTRAWQSNGMPVVFFYGATWCPYCAGSSWSVYKALTGYATVGNVYTTFSSFSDIGGGIPEVLLAGLSLSPKNGHGPAIDFQAAEDTSGVEPNLPGTANCYQSAYVTAYSAGIPFYAINGQVVHPGTLNDPYCLSPWSHPNGTGGPTTVLNDVRGETGAPWSCVQSQTWWVMAFIAKYLGYNVNTVSTLGGSSEYQWSPTTLSEVTTDLSQIT